MTGALRSPWLPVLGAVLLPLAVAALVLPWRTDLPSAGAALVMVVAVVAVAARGHRAAGWLGALSAAAWFDLLLTRPYGSLSITGRDDVVVTVLLLAVGVAVTELAVRGRHHRAVAALDEAHLAALAEVAGAASAAEAVALARTALARVLQARDVRFERGRVGGLPRLTGDGRLRIADGWWPLEDGLPDLAFEVVAAHGGTALGRYVVDPGPGAHPDATARRVAVVLADLVGAALAQGARRPSPA